MVKLFVIELVEDLLIGQGANRVCYEHPFESDKCIKIPYEKGLQAQILECNYYQNLTTYLNNWDHLSRYYGAVSTNLGTGYVYELIRDYDGRISSSISRLLSEESGVELRQSMQKSLQILKLYLLRHRIVVRNLKPYNILFCKQKNNDGIAILIDNLGHHNGRFHLNDHIGYLARKNTLRKWKALEMTMI